jgi:hypothetical protein
MGYVLINDFRAMTCQQFKGNTNHTCPSIMREIVKWFEEFLIISMRY